MSAGTPHLRWWGADGIFHVRVFVMGNEVTPIEAGPRKISRKVTVPAPASEIFALVVDPRRHAELDGSGTVVSAVKADGPMQPGAKFSVKMKMFGLPYRITSKATEVVPDRVVEWQHPLGHKWRYELAETNGSTEVVETWDYTTSKAPKVLELMGMPARNVAGIEGTLTKLRAKYAR